MTTHLILPYKWVACSQNDCKVAAHLNLPLHEIKNFPQEWVHALAGITWRTQTWDNSGVKDPTTGTWLTEPDTEETITCLDAENRKHNDDGPAEESFYKNPASATTTERKTWYIHGKVHREDGPAVIISNGTQAWFLNDEKHRANAPAVIFGNGTTEWWVNGQLHRENGPAASYPDGMTKWYLNGVKHREDGPAIKWGDGTIEWWLNGIQQENKTTP